MTTITPMAPKRRRSRQRRRIWRRVRSRRPPAQKQVVQPQTRAAKAIVMMSVRRRRTRGTSSSRRRTTARSWSPRTTRPMRKSRRGTSLPLLVLYAVVNRCVNFVDLSQAKRNKMMAAKATPVPVAATSRAAVAHQHRKRAVQQIEKNYAATGETSFLVSTNPNGGIWVHTLNVPMALGSTAAKHRLEDVLLERTSELGLGLVGTSVLCEFVCFDFVTIDSKKKQLRWTVAAKHWRIIDPL